MLPPCLRRSRLRAHLTLTCHIVHTVGWAREGTPRRCSSRLGTAAIDICAALHLDLRAGCVAAYSFSSHSEAHFMARFGSISGARKKESCAALVCGATAPVSTPVTSRATTSAPLCRARKTMKLFRDQCTEFWSSTHACKQLR